MKSKALPEEGRLTQATPADYETALRHAGQGKFQYLLMAAVGLYYIACGFQTLSISYLLPSAECDLQLTTHEKGYLNSSPFIGSLLGAPLWGKLADSWGRRSVIVTALFLDGVAGIISSFMQSLWPLVFFRLITGFTNLAALSVCFPYIGEMHLSKYRSRAICWMEIYGALGIVLIPLVAWAIIPRPWMLGSHEIGFRYNSWRIFIAVATIPSLLCSLAVFFFPESPAFLLSRGKHDQALDAFQRIYHINSGKPKNSYPIKQLVVIDSIEEVELESEGKVQKEEGITARLLTILNQMADLFRPPLLKNTMIGLCSLFSLQLGFFGFGMWFPELFNRFEEFSIAYPDETATVCEVANMDFESLGTLARNSTPGDLNTTSDCLGDTIHTQVFINTFAIGFTCICNAILMGLFVERIGRKRLIVTAMLLTAACGAGSYFVRSAIQNLLLSCFLQAFNGTSFSVLSSVLIELFPTSLRGLAMTILMNLSNVGSIVGNLMFGLLLDVDCAIPVFVSAGVMGFCGLLCFFLPNTKNFQMS
ncbi:hypothetical protein J437_LFUL011736 [Ladona fulva]|uniref:Major facilitator superfamily (MFS) profile domain-containing protein n=1 Tax=Ladona fulva TaxID=123851 RepID=A0A8K0P420_LADFU|nr:hypothetical protein J437_LFUL011736 [Ladona fulva]